MEVKKDSEFLKWSLYLLDKGITTVNVHYSGGGDSGAIDDVYFHKNAEELRVTTPGVYVPISIESIDPGAGAYFENLVEPLLNKIEDWWNNDGGYGECFIDLATGSYTIENNVEHREVTSYEHKGKFSDEND